MTMSFPLVKLSLIVIKALEYSVLTFAIYSQTLSNLQYRLDNLDLIKTVV